MINSASTPQRCFSSSQRLPSQERAGVRYDSVITLVLPWLRAGDRMHKRQAGIKGNGHLRCPSDDFRAFGSKANGAHNILDVECFVAFHFLSMNTCPDRTIDIVEYLGGDGPQAETAEMDLGRAPASQSGPLRAIERIR